MCIYIYTYVLCILYIYIYWLVPSSLSKSLTSSHQVYTTMIPKRAQSLREWLGTIMYTYITNNMMCICRWGIFNDLPVSTPGYTLAVLQDQFKVTNGTQRIRPNYCTPSNPRVYWSSPIKNEWKWRRLGGIPIENISKNIACLQIRYL